MTCVFTFVLRLYACIHVVHCAKQAEAFVYRYTCSLIYEFSVSVNTQVQSLCVYSELCTYVNLCTVHIHSVTQGRYNVNVVYCTEQYHR